MGVIVVLEKNLILNCRQIEYPYSLIAASF